MGGPLFPCSSKCDFGCIHLGDLQETAVVDVDLSAAPASAAQSGLNAAVERYYDTTLDLYEDLWGEHVHHGYWDPGETPDTQGADRRAATDRLVRELVAFAGIRERSHVLDVGCGIGGSALYLAGALGCAVDG